MRLVGKITLYEAIRADSAISVWIRAWLYELSGSNWKQASDVSEQFPNVRESDSGHFVFPIKGSNKKVSLKIAFPQGVAVVTGIK